MPSGRYRTRSLVFRKMPSEGDAERLANAMGWPVRGEIPADYARGIPREVQWSAGPAITLHYLEDDLSGNAYLVVSGDRKEIAEATAGIAEQHLAAFFSYEELLDSISKARKEPEKCRALVRAALGAPREFDDRLFEIVRISLRDKSPAVRESAIWATSYAAWPQFRGLLEDVVAHDHNQHVHDTAEGMLGAFDAAEGNERFPS